MQIRLAGVITNLIEVQRPSARPDSFLVPARRLKFRSPLIVMGIIEPLSIARYINKKLQRNFLDRADRRPTACAYPVWP